MYRRCYIILVVATISPIAVFPHFIWPLSYCVLADICNHTWIPECGRLVVGKINETKLFIDPCDMYEFNCDKNKSYEIVTYADCFGAVVCPQNKIRRIGNYKYHLQGRRMVHDPTGKPSKPPSLPKHMMAGKRRYDSEVRRRIMREKIVREYNNKKKASKKTTKKPTTKKTTIKKTTTTEEIPTRKVTTEISKVIPATEMYLIRKDVVIKNGKKVIKVIKGVRFVTEDDNFLE